jgi:hypothetical protein
VNREVSTPLILLAVILLCVLVIVGDWIRSVSTEAFAAFIGTLVATFVGVGTAAYIGVRRFYAEAEATEIRRSQILAESLAAEMSTALDILRGCPNVVIADPNGGAADIPVIFAQLTPTAVEEAIRVGLLGSQSTANLSQISNLMREYTTASDNLYPLVNAWHRDETDLTLWKTAYKAATNVDRLKQNVILWCEENLKHLENQGVQMPEDRHFCSNPERVATYKAGSPPD